MLIDEIDFCVIHGLKQTYWQEGMSEANVEKFRIEERGNDRQVTA